MTLHAFWIAVGFYGIWVGGTLLLALAAACVADAWRYIHTKFHS